MTWKPIAGSTGYEERTAYLTSNGIGATKYEIRKTGGPFYFTHCSMPVPSCCGASWWYSFGIVDISSLSIDRSGYTYHTKKLEPADKEALQAWIKKRIALWPHIIHAIIHDEEYAKKTYTEVAGYSGYVACCQALKECGHVMSTFKNPLHNSTLELLEFRPSDYGNNYKFKVPNHA